ncbi:unnamed protein product [Brugia pahangi]|uniref:Uncharacterized protein n=1 Tax=Brugia pahangi TaxID=6280 RepID=A0A0N4TXM9_BRUPA|nr:unnamed protein product [Brugia pahangi]
MTILVLQTRKNDEKRLKLVRRSECNLKNVYVRTLLTIVKLFLDTYTIYLQEGNVIRTIFESHLNV